MKRYISFILSALLIFTFASCGKKDDGATSSTETPSAKELTSNINASTVISDENTLKDEKQRVITGIADPTALSGFAPLDTVSYKVTTSTVNLSNEKLSHSHGPASGGKPHYTVVSFQKTFDKFGAVTLDTISEEKVLYLTFDCGYEYENLTSQILDVLKEKDVPAAFFCTLDHIKSEPNLIARMIKEGHIVGNHSTTHPSFAEITREEMAKEIEETENYLRENFGYAAKYFRFPAGEYTENALDLVESLGYVSVFWSVAYDDWDTSKLRGKDYATGKVLERLHDGAIILLHSVSKDNAAALSDIIDSAREQGFEFKALTDYNN